jgi:hypothetical protein
VLAVIPLVVARRVGAVTSGRRRFPPPPEHLLPAASQTLAQTLARGAGRPVAPGVRTRPWASRAWLESLQLARAPGGPRLCTQQPLPVLPSTLARAPGNSCPCRAAGSPAARRLVRRDTTSIAVAGAAPGISALSQRGRDHRSAGRGRWPVARVRPSGPALLEPLLGDLYGYEQVLPEEDQPVLLPLRGWLQGEVAPVANARWSRRRGRFGILRAGRRASAQAAERSRSGAASFAFWTPGTAALAGPTCTASNAVD